MSISHKLAWTAGFFDGEGFVTIQKRNYKGYQSHYLRIGINHVNPTPLYHLQTIFGGSVRKDKNVQGNRKPRHSWGLSCNKAKSFLIQILPYLQNKKEVAELGIELQNSINPEIHKTIRVSEDAYNKRESIKQLIMLINSKD